ncbi:multiple myeloma tumor-associated protein 2 homolog [Sycon ciliatum]|uniref:multiple myeloma tumor-associated protein 2 homolog n=1 Tax=Sycon ciliatum TaxID=27933 RepID=UPI0031F658E9
MAIYHPSRGGVRGGADQFDWEDVKTDKDRECYLGHTVKAPSGRWQKGQDLTWFNKDKSTAGLKDLDAERRKAEIAAIKHQEEEMMAVALGRKPPPKPEPTDQLSKAEMKMLMKGETGDQNEKQDDNEAVKADKIKGLGYSNQRLAMMGGVGRAERETAAGTDNTTAGSEQLSRHTVAPGPAGHTLPEDYEGKKSKKSKKDKKEKKSKKEKKEKKKSKDKECDLDEDEHARRQGNSERPPRDRDSRRDNSLNPGPGGDKQSSHVMQRQADHASKSAFSSPPRRHHSRSRSPRRQDRVQAQSRHRRSPSPPSHRRRSRSRSPSSSTRGQGRNASPPGQRGQRRSPMMRRRRQPSFSPERAERRRERHDRSRSPRRQQPQHRAASPDRRTAISHHRSAVHDSARSRSPVREARRSRSPMRNTRRDRSPESNSRRHAYSPVRSRKRSRSPVRRSRRSHSPEDPHSSRNRRN